MSADPEHIVTQLGQMAALTRQTPPADPGYKSARVPTGVELARALPGGDVQDVADVAERFELINAAERAKLREAMPEIAQARLALLALRIVEPELVKYDDAIKRRRADDPVARLEQLRLLYSLPASEAEAIARAEYNAAHPDPFAHAEHITRGLRRRANSPEEAWAQVHEVLNSPVRAFGSKGSELLNNPQMGIVCPVSRRTLQVLGRSLAGTQATVVGRVHNRADGRSTQVLDLALLIRLNHGDSFCMVAFETRLEAEGNSRERLVQAASVFGAFGESVEGYDHHNPDLQHLLNALRAAVGEGGLTERSFDIISRDVIRLEQWDWRDALLPGATAARHLTLDCEHDKLEWRLSPADCALLLECRTCGHGPLNAVALHRLSIEDIPMEHAVELEPEDWLRRAQLRDITAGVAPERTFADYTRRDGIVSAATLRELLESGSTRPIGIATDQGRTRRARLRA